VPGFVRRPGLRPLGVLGWPGTCFQAKDMARIPRHLLVEEGSVNHCTWRSNQFAYVLDSDEACEKLIALWRKYKEEFGIEIHSYCLMGTHPHVVCLSRLGQKAFSKFWKRVNQCFARWTNRRTGGRWKVVMERMQSPRIQDGRHLLAVMRYGDMNPVRAGVATSPSQWKWSSFRHYAFGEPNDLITDAPEYLALGSTAALRRQAYLHLFARKVGDLVLRFIDLVRGPFIGDDAWVTTRLEACGLSPPR
jgi:putative transposase